jgi:putative copper export protein
VSNPLLSEAEAFRWFVRIVAVIAVIVAIVLIVRALT